MPLDPLSDPLLSIVALTLLNEKLLAGFCSRERAVVPDTLAPDAVVSKRLDPLKPAAGPMSKMPG